MHRTQLLLENWQYESLRAAAEREGRSMAQLIRDAVSHYLGVERPPRREGLAAIAGIGEDPDATGRDHDRLLYADRSD